jgi:hypothetical protein
MLEEGLHDPILQRVERDHSDDTALRQARRELPKALLQGFKLAIHRDTQCLENTGRRMRSAPTRDDRFDGFSQLERRFEWFHHPLARKFYGHFARRWFIAILAKDSLELFTAHRVDEISSGDRSIRIKAHVQWAIRLKTESPFRRIELMGRHAKVEQRAIDLGYAKFFKQLNGIGECPSDSLEEATESSETATRKGQRRRDPDRCRLPAHHV